MTALRFALSDCDEIPRSKGLFAGQLRAQYKASAFFGEGTHDGGGVHEELDTDSDDRGAGAPAGGLRDGEKQPHELGEDVPGARRHLRLDDADVFAPGIA